MKVAILGTGYVGLVSGACLADFGHTVVCADTDVSRIDQLRRGDIPFYEPGLSEVVSRNAAVGRLRFTTAAGTAVSESLVVFLAVGTPQLENGEADTSQVIAATREIGANLNGYKVIATKSTVPIGTGARLGDIIREGPGRSREFDVVANPEFLREGSAIEDFMRPDRIVIGVSSERAVAIMREIYRPLYLIETPFVFTDVETAEMIKYASNAFLAVKIGFINEVANLCERVGADVHVVAKGMGLDKRIGSKFLHPGPGYGGSCFPKDTRALTALGERLGASQEIVRTAIAVNLRQREVVVEKLQHALGGLIQRQIAVLGLSFKPNTSDVRESPALHLCRCLVSRDARVRAFDPVANRAAAQALGDVAAAVHFADGVCDAVTGTDALVIMTEWNEFRTLDLERIRLLMRGAVLIDARNVLDPHAARALGFTYFGTGRGLCADRALA